MADITRLIAEFERRGIAVDSFEFDGTSGSLTGTTDADGVITATFDATGGMSITSDFDGDGWIDLFTVDSRPEIGSLLEHEGIFFF